MPFGLWRELAAAYVRVVAFGHGWRVLRVRASLTSRSWYVVLRRGRRRAEVRLSDHGPGPGRSRRARMFSVVQSATGRLDALPAFLAACAVQHPKRTIPLPATGDGDRWPGGG
jgi:hypothetical protein